MPIGGFGEAGPENAIHLSKIVEFTYKITLDDLLRFWEHVHRTSPRIRLKKLLWCIITPLFFAAWAILYYWETRSFDWLLLLIGIPAVSSALLLPRLIDRLSLRGVLVRYIERPEVDDTGLLRLVVTDDSVTEISTNRQIRLMWGQIHTIETLPDCVYIYADPHSAIVIPRHSFDTEQAYDNLQKELSKHFQRGVLTS